MRAIFQQFDTDNSGFITRQNIKIAMEKMGRDISDEEIDNIMKEHDAGGNDQLEYDEFARIFMQDVWDKNKTTQTEVERKPVSGEKYVLNDISQKKEHNLRFGTIQKIK